MKYLNYAVTISIRAFVILVVTFVWTNYYYRSFAKAFTTSLLIVIAIEILLFLKHRKTCKISSANSAHKNTIKHINDALILNPSTYTLDYYSNIIKTKYFSQKYKDCIVAVIDGKKVCFACAYKINGCDDNSLIECIRIACNHKCDKLIVLSNCFDDNLEKITRSIKGIEVELKDTNSLFESLIYGNETPVCPVYIDNAKYTFKDLINVAFNKKRTKNYVFCGIIIMLSSLLVPYSIYYVIIGTINMIFALVCYTKKN